MDTSSHGFCRTPRWCAFRALDADGIKPNSGECVPFAAPNLPALEAPVVWLPALTHTLLHVDADCLGVDHNCDFDVRKLPFTVHVHFDADGTQHVVLEAPSFHVALVVTGSLVSMGPVRLQFASAGVCALDGHLDALGALAHVLLGRRIYRAADRPGDVDRSNLRDAIIALDGERAGASRREIATVIFGAERVAEEWREPNGAMKAVIKRNLLRGRRYVAGGYRAFIGGGSCTSST